MLRLRGESKVTVFVKDANGQMIAKEITPTFAKAVDAPNPLKDVANEFIKNERTLHQDVATEGSSANPQALSFSDIQALLPAAKKYWSDSEASESALASAQFSVGALPASVAGLTSGVHITLSTDAAGWRWFIDSTPLANEEFIAGLVSTDLQSDQSSPASGKLDLLTLRIHELGHVLGLESRQADDVMTRVFDPGERRLPSSVDAFYLGLVGSQSGGAASGVGVVGQASGASWVRPSGGCH
jgi:hypothetical protein